MQRSTRVYVIRHGQSTFNAEGRFQGCCDEPVLTSAGVATTEAAAAYLQDANLDVVMTSPLRRASQTAVRMFQRLWRCIGEGPRFKIDPQLREIDLPHWEGWPLARVREEFGDLYRDGKQQRHLFRLPEQPAAVPALFAQASVFWDSMLDRFAGRNILLVTHDGTGRALISTALGIAPEHFHRMQQSNGGISVLEFAAGRSRPACLHALNAVDYLGQNLPKLKETKTGLRIVIVPVGTASRLQTQHASRVLRNLPVDASFADSAVNQDVAAQLRDGAVAGLCAHLPAPVVPADSLATVLWVAGEELARHTVAGLLGIPPALETLFPVPFTFTVLHYPGPGRAPTLQAMNLHDCARLSRGYAAGHAAAGEPFLWASPRSSRI